MFYLFIYFFVLKTIDVQKYSLTCRICPSYAEGIENDSNSIFFYLKPAVILVLIFVTRFYFSILPFVIFFSKIMLIKIKPFITKNKLL